MPKPIHMPKLSDEMTEGRLSEWLKKEGDEVKAGDAVAQVETDKATLDVEAFEPGVILAILVKKGETAPVGAPIAWIGKAGEKVPEAPARPPTPAPAAAPAATPTAPPTPRPAPVVAAVPHRPPAPPGGRNGRVIASPAARKLAREQGLDLATLPGSGPGGRVVLGDVERARAAPPPAAPVAPPAPARRRRELPPRRELREESIPLSPMRKAIARNLAAAKPGAPHFYLEISVDMRRAVAMREQLSEMGEGEVSLNDLVLKAAAEALRRHPEMNAAWAGDAVLRRGGVHLGMAVAVEEGLVTPVIRDADRLSIFEVARLARELARRARDRKLKPDEYQGATFTVSNLGMFGIEAFYAVLNPPEAGILAVGAVQKVPWVDETGAVVAMERCRLGLSGDHRVVDGATGARFLETLKSVLETPVRLVMR